MKQFIINENILKMMYQILERTPAGGGVAHLLVALEQLQPMEDKEQPIEEQKDDE